MARFAPQTTLSIPKKLVFATIAIVLVLLLLEGVLAFVGVRPMLRDEDPYVGFARGVPLFERTADADGGETWVTAHNKRAFFNVQRFVADKGDDVVRVFCLGGSTTYGRPYDDTTSFAGWLRELLPVADPSRRYEVVNAGGISYASYRIAALMDELVRYEPDVFVVYTGHNEFLEERTYGEFRRRSGLVQDLAARVTATRIGTTIRRVADAVRDDGGTDGEDEEAGDDDARTWLPDAVVAKLDHSAGLDLYERDDDLRDAIVDHYRMSLERIVRAARNVGAEVVLVRPASNLRDFAPFKSQPTREFTAEESGRIEAWIAEAETAGGDAAAAAEAFGNAVEMDPRNADLRYRHGRALSAAGDTESAAEAFLRARDEDVCPLRAPREIQDAARDVAVRLDVPFVDYVDLLDRAVRDRGPHRVPGDDLFLDHVHPTIEGHRLLAVALVETLADTGAIPLGDGWTAAAIADVARRVEGQIDPSKHARALANLALTLSWAGKAEESRRLTERALDAGVEDPTILMMAARHAAVGGSPDDAAAYFRRAIRAAPEAPVAHQQFALFLIGQRRLEAAAAHALRSVAEWPENEKAHRQLGLALALRGRREAALAAYLEAAKIDPANASLAASIEETRASLPAGADSIPTRRLAAARYDSGRLRRLTQARPDPSGGFVSDGIRVEFHENGLPARFVDMVDGLERGIEVVWNESGMETGRRPVP